MREGYRGIEVEIRCRERQERGLRTMPWSCLHYTSEPGKSQQKDPEGKGAKGNPRSRPTVSNASGWSGN